MANYYGNTRTNYFRVTDEEKFKNILSKCNVSDDELETWERNVDGNKYFAFGGYGSLICYKDSEAEDDDLELDDIEIIYEKLSTVVHPEDAIIITEIGNEKLRYLIGASVIITCNAVEYIDIHDESIKAARKLLNNNRYNSIISY